MEIMSMKIENQSKGSSQSTPLSKVPESVSLLLLTRVANLLDQGLL